MRNHKIKVINRKLMLAIALIISLFSVPIAAQETFDKAEFAARRAKVFEKIGDAAAIFFANEKHRYPVKFRQAPDFFYLTGIEEPRRRDPASIWLAVEAARRGAAIVRVHDVAGTCQALAVSQAMR